MKFTHEIDSHSTSESGDYDEGEVADEGIFTKLPNGDDLEIGEMPAPHLGGKVAAYREVWRELNPCLEDTTREDKSTTTCWMLESVDTQEQVQRRTFYCRVGRFFLAIRRTERRLSDQGGAEIEFAGIRQEETRPRDGGEKEWTVQYSVGKEVDDMFHMSTSEFVLDNTTSGDSSWKVDDQVVVKNKKDGAVREVCVVRAVH